jgi:hypothetical protein
VGGFGPATRESLSSGAERWGRGAAHSTAQGTRGNESKKARKTDPPNEYKKV